LYTRYPDVQMKVTGACPLTASVIQRTRAGIN
jgi:hypothetical protein